MARRCRFSGAYRFQWDPSDHLRRYSLGIVAIPCRLRVFTLPVKTAVIHTGACARALRGPRPRRRSIPLVLPVWRIPSAECRPPRFFSHRAPINIITIPATGRSRRHKHGRGSRRAASTTPTRVLVAFSVIAVNGPFDVVNISSGPPREKTDDVFNDCRPKAIPRISTVVCGGAATTTLTPTARPNAIHGGRTKQTGPVRVLA